MKVIAMYLPQFHRVKENDMWWGEGYTDWVATEKAEALFENHYQPHIPYNNNYYDLLEKKVMEWQAGLMHDYGIDGMCIYHYWFKDGRQVLEKPAENLLKWKDIQMPYCFCWANQTWARSWSNIPEKNAWADAYEKEISGTGVLLEQKYGGENEWRKHLEYLLPFFQDERYLKIDGKPVFVIYRGDLTEHLNEMIELWNELLIKNGFLGLFLIGSKTDYYTRDVVDAELHIEPEKGTRYVSHKNMKGVTVLDYDEVWESILSEPSLKEKTYFGGFVGYDDTPRRGKAGIVVWNASPPKFGIYLSRLMAKNQANGMQLTFINAWNEWGEGMHLEPDEKNQYQYLEQINYAKTQYEKFIPYYEIQKKIFSEKYIQIPLREREKFEIYFDIVNKWMDLHEKQISLTTYLMKMGYCNVGIYGYGKLGKHLVYELRGTEIAICYIIDQRQIDVDEGVMVYRPQDVLPKTDVIINTAVYYEQEIQEKLSGTGLPVISLATVINEALKL